MKNIFLITFLISSITLYSFNTNIEFSKVSVKDTTLIEKQTKITPISHATFILEVKDIVIYIDPTGGAEAFKDKKSSLFIFLSSFLKSK